jgi:hypothetical protein
VECLRLVSGVSSMLLFGRSRGRHNYQRLILDHMMVQGTSRLLAEASSAASPFTSSVKADALIAFGCMLVLLALRMKLRMRRRRVSRAYARSMRHSSQGEQIKSLGKSRVLAKAAAAGRSKWAFRKAAVVAVLLFGLRVWFEMHSR